MCSCPRARPSETSVRSRGPPAAASASTTGLGLPSVWLRLWRGTVQPCRLAGPLAAVVGQPPPTRPVLPPSDMAVRACAHALYDHRHFCGLPGRTTAGPCRPAFAQSIPARDFAFVSTWAGADDATSFSSRRAMPSGRRVRKRLSDLRSAGAKPQAQSPPRSRQHAAGAPSLVALNDPSMNTAYSSRLRHTNYTCVSSRPQRTTPPAAPSAPGARRWSPSTLLRPAPARSTDQPAMAAACIADQGGRLAFNIMRHHTIMTRLMASDGAWRGDPHITAVMAARRAFGPGGTPCPLRGPSAKTVGA